MAEGQRGGGWRPPNDDDEDRRADEPPKGGLWSGDPLAGAGQPPSGAGSSSGGGEPPTGDSPQQGAWEPPTGSSPQQRGWEPPSGSGSSSSLPGGWEPPAGASSPSSGWGPPPGGAQPGTQWGAPRVQTSNGKATAALVLGIVGIFVCPIVCSTLAIIFGYQGRNEIDRSQGRQSNRGQATAGIVLGWIGIAIGAAIIALAIVGAASDDGSGDFEESEPVGQPAVRLAARVLLALPGL